MHLAPSQKTMREELRKFGVDYCYPCFASAYDITKAFSYCAHPRTAFIACTESNELLLYIDGHGEGKHIAIARNEADDPELKKAALLPSHILRIGGVYEGERYRYKLIIPHRIFAQFPGQRENSAELLSFIGNWI